MRAFKMFQKQIAKSWVSLSAGLLLVLLFSALIAVIVGYALFRGNPNQADMLPDDVTTRIYIA